MFPARYFASRYFAPRYWPIDGVQDVGLGIVEAMQLYSPGADIIRSYSPGADAIQLSGE